jgi:amidohydrolase
MDRIEKRIIEIIDNNRDRIIAFGRDIHAHAEMGYKEFRTAEKFAAALADLGLPVKRELAITGVKSTLKSENGEKLCVALLGEFDALMIPENASSNPETGAAHCCGHDAQLTAVLGAAIALCDDEIRQALEGDVCFFGVPSEEYGEVEFKDSLLKAGKIRYGGGKSELIRIGAFDDIDMCIAHHSGPAPLSVGSGTNSGFVSKVIRIKGRASHAAGSPEKGINALNAAALGLSAMSMIRETFRDEDHVRVHAIMTKGGDLVNVIPNNVVLEGLVRSLTMEAVKETEVKFDRAFLGGAISMGAGVDISTRPGYLPCIPVAENEVLIESSALAAPSIEPYVTPADSHGGGSTDVGDLQHLMPVLQFRTGGFTGVTHGSDFTVVDEDLYYILPAKIFALASYKLLKDRSKKAREHTVGYKPKLTKQTYIEYMESMIRDEVLAEPVR